jgi:hypothetical protein
MPADTTASTYGQTGNGSSSYSGSEYAGGYGSGASDYGYAGQTQSQPANLSYPTTPSTQQVAAPSPYGPGSTGRTTPYGSSSNLSVPGSENVQPASFAGGSTPTPDSPSSETTTPSSPGAYGSGSYTLPTQTATPTSPYSYPETYQR